jgi:hypothetical protein
LCISSKQEKMGFLVSLIFLMSSQHRFNITIIGITGFSKTCFSQMISQETTIVPIFVFSAQKTSHRPLLVGPCESVSASWTSICHPVLHVRICRTGNSLHQIIDWIWSNHLQLFRLELTCPIECITQFRREYDEICLSTIQLYALQDLALLQCFHTLNIEISTYICSSLLPCFTWLSDRKLNWYSIINHDSLHYESSPHQSLLSKYQDGNIKTVDKALRRI